MSSRVAWATETGPVSKQQQKSIKKLKSTTSLCLCRKHTNHRAYVLSFEGIFPTNTFTQIAQRINFRICLCDSKALHKREALLKLLLGHLCRMSHELPGAPPRVLWTEQALRGLLLPPKEPSSGEGRRACCCHRTACADCSHLIPSLPFSVVLERNLCRRPLTLHC